MARLALPPKIMRQTVRAEIGHTVTHIVRQRRILSATIIARTEVLPTKLMRRGQAAALSKSASAWNSKFNGAVTT